jgi:hypothetical protein
MKKKKSTGVTELDMSGSNDDGIPREAKTSAKASKSRKRLKETRELSEQRKSEKDAEENGVVKKKNIKRVKEKSATVDKLKKKAENDIEGKKKKKKRIKKTVGQLLSEGRTERAKDKAVRMGGKSMAKVEKLSGLSEQELEPLGGMVTVAPDFASEGDFLEQYQRIYLRLGAIMQKLERKIDNPNAKRISNKDIYALMTMYSQMRETIADMRSIKDLNAQAEDLAREVFDPATKSAGESLIAMYYSLIQIIRQEVKDINVVETINEKMKHVAAEQANKLQQDFSDARSTIIEVMNGNR